MRKRKASLLAGIAIAISLASLYAIYSALEGDSRHEGLGSLLEAGEDAEVAQLEGAGAQMVSDYLHATAEYKMAVDFLTAKGMDLDQSQEIAYQANVGGENLSILRALTAVSANGTMAEVILILDQENAVSAWIMSTNLPPETSVGADPKANYIPVYVWSNGMPVFYVYFHHLIGGRWVPYHYLWHDSHDHPNWYYSHYNYWWWYYGWYDIDWPHWHDWFFSWYYNTRLCYWSTWFPIGEPCGTLLAILLSIAIPSLAWAKVSRSA